MSLDDFVITVFCRVDDFLTDFFDGKRLRQRGPRPTVPDSVVLTCELVGEFLEYDTDNGIFSSFRRHHATFFRRFRRSIARPSCDKQPTSGRSKKRLQFHLQVQIDGTPLVTITGSFPVPVCRFARAPRCKETDFELAFEVAYGYDELARQAFYGLQAHMAVSWPGVIRSAKLAPANVSDVEMAPEVLFGARGWALADRNCCGPDPAEKLKRDDTVLLVPLESKTYKNTPFPPNLTHMRRRIETVIYQLVGRFNAKKVWATGRWHAVSRWLREMTSHTMAVLLCRRQGLPPLRFAELIDD